MAPTKPRGTPLLVPERRGVQINHAAAAVTSGHEDDALEPGMKVSHPARMFEDMDNLETA